MASAEYNHVSALAQYLNDLFSQGFRKTLHTDIKEDIKRCYRFNLSDQDWNDGFSPRRILRILANKVGFQLVSRAYIFPCEVSCDTNSKPYTFAATDVLAFLPVLKSSAGKVRESALSTNCS